MSPSQPSTPPQPQSVIKSGPYDTPIPPDRQGDYLQWLKDESQRQGRDISRDTEDYDLQGYFMAGAGTDQRGHGPDTFKKPNHPTFSTESKYSPQFGNNAGGQWMDRNGQGYFVASPADLRYRNLGDLQNYFRQVEPETKLIPPPPGSEQLGTPGPPNPPLPTALGRYKSFRKKGM